MTTHHDTGDDARITLTLDAHEIPAFGACVLNEINDVTDGLSVPYSWPRWRETRDDDRFARLAFLMRTLEALTSADRRAGQPVSIEWPSTALRELLREGVDIERETMADALKERTRPNVDKYQQAARSFTTLVSLLDRLGWGDEPDEINDVRRLAEVLA